MVELTNEEREYVRERGVVIVEHCRFRGRTEQRYQLMMRLKSRNGLNHVYSGYLFTLEDAQKEAEKNGWEVLAVGDFYQVV